MEWLLAHKAEIVMLVPFIIGIASIIVKWTPTPKDDAALAWLVKLLEKVSLNKSPTK